MPTNEKPPHDPLNEPKEPTGRRKPLRPSKPTDGRLCGGHKTNGQECKLPAGYLTDHIGFGRCCWHGGATDTGKAAAAKDRAVDLIKFYGAPLDTDPINVLLDEVRRTAGHVAFLGQKVANWPQDQLSESGGITPELKGWIDLYQSERKHLVWVAKAALDAGVNERLVQIAEHQGMRLADSVEMILKSLNLTPEQQALIPEVVPRALRGLVAAPQLIEGMVERDDH